MRLDECGVDYELLQPVGVDPADELLDVMAAPTPSCW